MENHAGVILYTYSFLSKYTNIIRKKYAQFKTINY